MAGHLPPPKPVSTGPAPMAPGAGEACAPAELTALVRALARQAAREMWQAAALPAAPRDGE